MDSSMREHVRRLVRAGKNRSQYAATLAFVSVFVVLAVVVGAIRQGISMVVPQQVLDCHYVGTGAHTHDASCYDADGNLVCPLTEREYHVHSDDCYTETRELACGFEEEHEHTDACYDEEGTLVCGLVEHVHTDACYKVTRELTCGKEETTEVHTHGPGCFRTVMIEDGTGEPDADQQVDDQQVVGQDVESDPAAEGGDAGQDAGQDAVDEALTPEEATEMPAQAFAHQFEDIDKNLVLRVDVSAPEGALPANSTMVATWVDPTTLDETTQKVVDKAISKAADGKVLDQQAVDITFFDAQGAEVEPAREVTVTFTSPLVATKDQPVVVHIDDSDETLAKTNGKPKAEAVAVLDERELARRDVTLAEDALAFDSDAFSTYVLALTSLQHTMDSTDGKTVTVSVDAPAEAGIPSDAVIRVTEIAQGSDDHAAYEASAVEALGVEDTRDVALARFFDIKIEDGQGQAIQPAEPVKVKIELSDAPSDAEDTGVVHFDEAGEAEVVEAKAAGETTTFDAAGFSVYGVVYTVDFHWSVNGKDYEYSLAGGDTVSLSELLTELHAVDEDVQSGINSDEVTEDFVNDVVDVRFSNEDLVAVVQITEGITAGALKKKHGLECEYSAELTNIQQKALDEKVFYAPDWALISLKPFDTEECLTVEMKSGESFQITVTDAQMQKEYISASGESYTITVTYGKDAEIPDDADLIVREIEVGSDEYSKYLIDSAKELGVEGDKVSSARFFDIEIVDVNDAKIEPKAPVYVDIKFKDAIEVGLGESVSIVHFANSGTEVIEDVLLDEDKTEITYEQSSFSVTGTIVTPTSSSSADNPNHYMLLVKYNSEYYIVNNDATLTKVRMNNNGTLDIDDPMLWSYENNHIYYYAEALGFDSNDVASDYLYRYIDPSADENGQSYYQEEDDPAVVRTYTPNTIYLGFTSYSPGRKIDPRNGAGWPYGAMQYNNGTIRNRDNRLKWNDMSISYDNNHIHHGNEYLGLAFDDDGNPVRLIGSQSDSDAAEIYFAEPQSVLSVGARNHTVNHIDISISGSSSVTVPLAYGSYWYGDPSNPASMQEYIVSTDTSLELEDDDVTITPEDMKRATIRAYDKNGNIVPEAYVISGYSSNDQNSYSTVQVRIEGQFKVADLNPYTGNGDANSQSIKNQRINNVITYTVSALKPITFDLKDETHGQLYEKLSDGSFKALSVTVDVNMSASFNYWDEDNQCPALKDEVMNQSVRSVWSGGGIPGDLSGMDFILGGDAEDADSKIVAIEITKMIVDENHQLINPKQAVTQSFDIFSSTSDKHGAGGVDNSNNVIGVNVPQFMQDYENYGMYTELHSKDVLVRNSGMGLVYDYDVEPGMYYIAEDSSKIPETIIDNSDEEWVYNHTYIETEYVWRNDNYSGRHVSVQYSDRNSDTYRSVPEIVGNYVGKQYSTDTDYNSEVFYNDETNKNEVFRNGFLEFYVYNVYKHAEGDLSLTKKVVGTGADPDKVFDFTITLKDSDGAPLTGNYEATLAGNAATATPDSDGKVNVTLKANQTYTIKDLPVGTTYSIVEADYAPDGYTATTTGGSLTGTIGDDASDAIVEVTNTYSAVDITVVKIDETTRNEAQQKKLEGAKFKLLKLTANPDNPQDQEYTPYPSETGCEKTTNDQGTLTFDTLPNGQYKLIESHVPDGYIAQSDLEVYFTVSYDTQQEKAVVTWTNAEGQQITQQNLVGYEPNNKTFTIGNTPGKELPAAGGPGTLLGTLFGAAMIATAAFVLVQRRRAQEA